MSHTDKLHALPTPALDPVRVYGLLADESLVNSFAGPDEDAAVAALDALFARADADETLRPLVVAMQDAMWRFAFAAHDAGLRFGTAYAKFTQEVQSGKTAA